MIGTAVDVYSPWPRRTCGPGKALSLFWQPEVPVVLSRIVIAVSDDHGADAAAEIANSTYAIDTNADATTWRPPAREPLIRARDGQETDLVATFLLSAMARGVPIAPGDRFMATFPNRGARCLVVRCAFWFYRQRIRKEA